MSQDALDQHIKQIASKAHANLPKTENERIEGMRKRFFSAIDEHYEFRQHILKHAKEQERYIQEAKRQGYNINNIPLDNISIPQFDVSRQVMADIFSFPEFEKTSELRNTKEEDKIIARMISEEAEKGPMILVDVGSFDFKRTLNYLSQANLKNIKHIIGIDTNDTILQHTPNLDIPLTAINGNFLELVPELQSLPERIHYVIPGNTIMNITHLSQGLHEGISPLYAEILRVGDSITSEKSKQYNPKRYVKGAEPQFSTYHKAVLEDLIGGVIRAEETHPDENSKLIFVDDIHETVTYNGKIYQFENPPLHINTMAGMIETDLFSKPYIHLGVSQSLSENEHFLIAIMNYIQDTLLEKENNWVEIGNNSIFTMTRKHRAQEYSDADLENALKSTAYMCMQQGMSRPIFRNFTDVTIGLGLYPEYFNKFLTDYDGLFRLPTQDEDKWGISPAVKEFAYRRATKGENNANMREYHSKIMMGYPVKEYKTFDIFEKSFGKPRNEMEISAIKINTPSKNDFGF